MTAKSTANFNLKLYGFQYCGVTQTHFNYICVPLLTEVTLKMVTGIAKTCC